MHQASCTILNKIINDIKIPSPPAIAVRIIEAVKKDAASFNELGKIISSDPALSVKILKISNSTFYSGYQKIGSISQALTRLGTKCVQNIALSFVITKEMRGVSNLVSIIKSLVLKY